ncbi:hypothetical protein KV697_10685 [Sphingomonas sanguinis]|uniref:hypothetical protein n=1 Tax=Sphingomonas sanguinis TaxID=33051 RepID=UPI001C5A4370|nr:hypothetical protein [Sphingomonas sanguinis]QXT34300.1 hypothetical protein KV697_10685 [Sphingomonas sanguinis]
MSGREAPIYQRGKYWLDHYKRKDGSRRSENFYVFWYDPAARRQCSASTGTGDEELARRNLDQRYLADRGEAAAFCETCGQPLASASGYLLTDAMADYNLEWGVNQVSGDTIVSRLNHVAAFLDAEEALGAKGRFGHATTCAVACSKPFVTAFRAWSRKQPVVWKNKKKEITKSRPRSPAATEAVIAQLIAALNWAADADPPRIDKRPIYKPLPAAQVQRTRRTRIGVEDLAKMLTYAAEPNVQRESLHAFLVASICTIARPGAVVDINVSPEREQWWPGAAQIDLNPRGRAQNKKHRALLPVLPLLDAWLREELAIFQSLSPDAREGRGWLVNYYGRGIQDVDRAWDTMLINLDMPQVKEMRPYVLRHSLATLVRNRGATRWDLEGFMGHRSGSQTEVYAVGEYPTVVTALEAIISDLEALAPGALRRKCAGTDQPYAFEGGEKMSP